MMLKASMTLVATAASIALATQALAGGSFRLEIGPAIAAGTDSKVKNAVLVVRPVACDDAATVRMTGTAEGVVNGTRQSVTLTLLPLATPGAQAVARQWPDGHWVLNLTAACPGRDATASAVVPIGGQSGFVREKTRFFPDIATPAQVDASLNELVRQPS